jgi:hypothetical protein
MDENLPNRIDHLFKNGLKDFENEPSDDVWNKIEEGLDADDLKVAVYSIKWVRYAAVIVLLIGGLGFLYKFNIDHDASSNHKSNFPTKAENHLVVSPKMSQRDNHPDENNRLMAASNGRKTKTAKRLFDKTDKNYIDIKNFYVGNEILNDSDNSHEKIVFINTPETDSHLNPLSQQLLADEKITKQSSSVVHHKARFKDRISFTPYLSKEFVGYSLTDNDLTGVNGQEIEENERNVFSAAVGFFVNYKINKRWTFQSGISYSWSNSNIDSATSYAVIDNHGIIQYKLITISGYGYLLPASNIQPNIGDSIYTAKSYSQLHYLTIPLILSYRIPLKRFSLLIGAGATFNVLTSAEIETKTYGNGQPEKEYSVNMGGLKKINYGMIMKFDLEYRINSCLGIDIIPCFKNTLSPINLEGAISAYPYNFGIGAGFTYHL